MVSAVQSRWGVGVDDYKRTVDRIIERKTRIIDVGVCVYTDEDNVPVRRYFLNCVNIGLGARLIDITSKATRLMGSKRLSVIPVAKCVRTQVVQRAYQG